MASEEKTTAKVKGDTPPDFGPTAPPPKGKDEKGKGDKPKDEAKAPRKRVTRAPSLQKQLEDAFATIAIGIAATGDMYCSQVVAQQAEPLATAWAELAAVNDRVRVMLERMMQGSVWGGVVFVTAATVIPIAAHHGILPERFPMPFNFGIGPPPPPSDEVKRAEGKGGEPAGS